MISKTHHIYRVQSFFFVALDNPQKFRIIREEVGDVDVTVSFHGMFFFFEANASLRVNDFGVWQSV